MPDPTERDPRFPNRPTHPDFARLSHAVQAQDMESEQPGFDYAAYTNSIIDLESLTYVAEQRAGNGMQQAIGLTLNDLPIQVKAFIVSTWMDGLMAGCLYERAGGHQ